MLLLKDQRCPPPLLEVNSNMASCRVLPSEGYHRWPSPLRSYRSRPAVARGHAHDRPDGRPGRVAAAVASEPYDVPLLVYPRGPSVIWGRPRSQRRRSRQGSPQHRRWPSVAMLTPSGRWVDSCPQCPAGPGQRPGLTLPVVGLMAVGRAPLAALPLPAATICQRARGQHGENPGLTHSPQ